MSVPTHDPLVVNTKDGSCWRRRAVTQSGHGLYAPAAVQGDVPELVLSTLPELAEHGLASMAFALPMPSAPKSLALSEQQIEALVAAGDRVVNDAVHEDLCMCDAWPERCVSTDNYFMGAWDVSGLDTALPAVLGLWESMRGGELERLRELVRQMVDGLNGHDCPPPNESPMQAVTRFAVRLMEAERQVAELEALELGDLDGRVSAACGDPEHPTWLRAKDDTRRCPWCRVAELEQVIAEAPASYVLMDRARAAADGISRAIVPVQALREDDEFHLHHTYRVPRDLPEPAGVQTSGACKACGSAPDSWCPDCGACQRGCYDGFVDNSCSHAGASWVGVE